MGDYRPEDIPLDILRKMQLPKWIFAISLIFGTLLLTVFLLSREPALIVFGLFYVCLAVIANAAVLAGMVVYAFRHRKYRDTILSGTAILLLNIPIAFAYIVIVMNSK